MLLLSVCAAPVGRYRFALDVLKGNPTVYPQEVTLYQTGDLVEGASFNNFLDAIDSSYCTSGGGDNPT